MKILKDVAKGIKEDSISLINYARDGINEHSGYMIPALFSFPIQKYDANKYNGIGSWLGDQSISVLLWPLLALYVSTFALSIITLIILIAPYIIIMGILERLRD